MELPLVFRQRMQKLLSEEYETFLSCYEKPPYQGVRLNSLKCGEETLRACLPFSISPSPFSPLSFYGPGEKVGTLPAYHAGMFYSQEPSAASAVTVLDPRPGERVLDLCAAPGGKSSQIAALMLGEGLLWSNEIVRSRAKILLSNLERMGVQNAVVSSCHPQKLCESLTGYFDRVLVDAPCSGEGMFRREPNAVKEWSPENVAACAQRQGAVLDSAALAVKEGGYLVYSTCTFSEEENEGAVEAFLRRHPEFQLCPVEVEFGRPALRMPARRIYPMEGGEGHFVAKFRRTRACSCRVRPFAGLLTGKELHAAQDFYGSLFGNQKPQRFAIFGERLLILPEEMPETVGMQVLRAGIELGERRGNRWEPSHSVFQSRAGRDCLRSVDYAPDAPELAAFLRGEELECSGKGYTAVCVSGVTTGFGKASGGKLKNKYPKGLRNLK